MEEVFRFMCLRPPEAVDLDPSNHVDTTNSNSVFQGQLQDMRDTENALEDMVSLSEDYTASEAFVGGLDQLTIPLKQFGEHLLQEESPNLAIVGQIVLVVFGQDTTTLITDQNYVNDRQNAADSLIALIIAREEQTQNYDDLVYALRLFGILERVAAQDTTLDTEEAIEEALNQVVLLPEGIFPLPPCRFPEETASEEQEAVTQEEIEDQQEAEILEQRLVNLQTALDELSSVRASDFRQVVAQEEAQELSELIPQDPSPWVLSEEFANRISRSSRAEIENLGISLDKTPLPELTQLLETELIRVGAQVYEAEEPRKVVKIGSTFFDVTDSLPEVVPSVSTGAGRRGAFSQIGVTDLLVVKQAIQKYEAGEIAHIENVLKGESKDRTHRRLKLSEETYLTETETTEESEKDLQSTDKFELQTAAQETIKQDSSLGVDVTVKYGGAVDVTANTKYATKKSSEKSTQTATTYARDVVNRSVSSIQEKVRKQQIKKTLQEVEVTNVHRIDNENGTDHVVGIYRYVDKVYKAQVYNYGERLMFEFVVPEPGAFASFALKNKTPEGVTMDKPLAPVSPDDGKAPLKPSHITPKNYQKLVAQYQVTNVDPPPPQKKYVPYVFRTSKDAKGYRNAAQISGNDYVIEGEKKDSVKVPDGYVATHAWCTMHVPHWAHYEKDYGNVANVTIGTQFKECHTGYLNFSINLSYNPTLVPIVVNTAHKTSVSISIEILCKRADALDDWQQKTYAAIITAYLNLKSEYEEQLAAAFVEEGIGISGSNPKLNRQLEKAELKKGALTLLMKKTHPHFNFIGSVETTKKDLTNRKRNQEYYKGYPEIDFAAIERNALYIQFFEQAFEWDQIMYTFYPYYWARKKLWPTLQQIQDTDPIHAQFLQAGAARVLVPVRPGYEDSILYYLNTGKPFHGGGRPSVTSKLYVSPVKTMQEKYGIYQTTREGTISVEKNRKIIKGKDTKFRKDDVDREIYIKGIQYRIAKVDSSKQVTLTEKYRGKDEQDIAYAIGIKFVGVPWRVKVPTTLVYLQQEHTKLPDFTNSENA